MRIKDESHIEVIATCSALFKINSEARSQGIVCEQELGDHA